MNQLATQASQASPPIRTGESSIFSNLQRFQEVQHMAQILSDSDLVPTSFKGKPANCIIALSMADRIQADPMMVMQNLYVVHGKPAWSSQFLIACVNNSGRFSSLQYDFFGEPNTEGWGCRAYATEKSSGETVYGPSVTLEMARLESWSTKAGSKWKTMPELMLTYRAAAFFVRTKAPEISMGMHTVEEEKDMGKAQVVPQTSSVQRKAVSLDDEVLGLAKSNDEREQQTQPEFDYVKLFKESIDSCPDLKTLNQCGDDIAQDIKQLTDDQQFEVKSYYDKKIKSLKAQKENS
tara:strand:+ start:35008 stop:35886 length:879 start_codon:yes stop_codon:yes gene_type:complete